MKIQFYMNLIYMAAKIGSTEESKLAATDPPKSYCFPVKNGTPFSPSFELPKDLSAL